MFCGMPGYKPQYAEKASNRLHDKSGNGTNLKGWYKINVQEVKDT